MARTDENGITAADWRLASDELAFVVELVGAEERALEVMGSLLDDLAKGLIRWDCDNFAVRGDFQTYPSLRIMFAAARGRAFFWRRDEHSRLNVDWPTSCAAWVGPLAGFGSDGRGNSWPIFDPCASTSLTASGVRFHHGDVIDRLVARGLIEFAQPTPNWVNLAASDFALTPEFAQPALGYEAGLAAIAFDLSPEFEQPTLSQAENLAGTGFDLVLDVAQPALGQTANLAAIDFVLALDFEGPQLGYEAGFAATEETAGAAMPALLPDDPVTILAVLGLKGFQQNAIAEAVLERYGRSPPENLTPGKLRKDLEALHKVQAAKAKARGDAPPAEPAGWDACKVFVKALRVWRAKAARPR